MAGMPVFKTEWHRLRSRGCGAAFRIDRRPDRRTIVQSMLLVRRLLGKGSTIGASAPTAEPLVPPVASADPSALFVLPAGALLGIAGESHYTSAIRKLGRTGEQSARALTVVSELAEDVAGREPDRKLRWFEAQLVPMPDNPYDANAVAVVSPHGQVGYLPRDDAAQYEEVFASRPT